MIYSFSMVALWKEGIRNGESDVIILSIIALVSQWRCFAVQTAVKKLISCWVCYDSFQSRCLCVCSVFVIKLWIERLLKNLLRSAYWHSSGEHMLLAISSLDRSLLKRAGKQSEKRWAKKNEKTRKRSSSFKVSASTVNLIKSWNFEKLVYLKADKAEFDCNQGCLLECNLRLSKFTLL